MTKRIIVNTDFFLFLAEGGPLRKLAADSLQSCQPCLLLTPRFVLAQSLDVVRSGSYSDTAARTMIEIMENVSRHRANAGLVKNASYLVIDSDDQSFRSAFSEYKRRADLDWPLTRHLLVALAKREGAKDALSAKEWFSEYGITPRIKLPPVAAVGNASQQHAADAEQADGQVAQPSQETLPFLGQI